MLVFSEIYKGIRDKILSDFTDVQYIDLQKEQFRNKKKNIPIPLPAVLVAINDVKWSNIDKGSQIGELEIEITHYVELVTESFDTAEQENETIEILDNFNTIFQVLQGHSTDYFSPLIRTQQNISEYGNGYIAMKTTFKTAVRQDLE